MLVNLILATQNTYNGYFFILYLVLDLVVRKYERVKMLLGDYFCSPLQSKTSKIQNNK